ncbi:MAG TPA: POTRA domain-containing protein [Bryobacteraceae bacterium]|nr:POTRA domain-containing protein [Bryobacteraceae bacterium]
MQVFRPGGIFHASDAAAAIDSLFATGYYQDVQIGAVPQGDEVSVRIITQRAWFVGHISVSGDLHNPPNEAELTDATRLDLGAPFREEDLTRAETNLNRLLQRNGFYEHSLRWETEDDPKTGQRAIKFIVETGPRASYGMPSIHGNTKLSDDDIVRATGWKRRFIGGWRAVTQERTRKGIAGIVKKYQKEDRLEARVTQQQPVYEPSTRKVQLYLDIDGGPKVDVRTVETEVSKRKLKRYVPIFELQAVNRGLLVQGERNLRDYFQSQGYYDVDVTFRQRQTDPDHLVIEYVIARGKRYKLVAIDIEGNKYFPDQDLRERMYLQPAGFIRFRHGRFSEEFLQRDKETIASLYEANGFRDVKVDSSVQTNYKGHAGDVAVTIRIDEGPQWLVARVDFAGFEGIPAADLQGELSSQPGEPFSEANVARDRDAILTAYQNKGFPDAAFQWNFGPDAKPNQVDVQYRISQGRREFVRGVLLSGIKTTRKALVTRNIDISPDDPLSLVQMSAVQRTLYELGIFSRIDMAIQDPDGVADHKYVLYDFQEASRYSLALGVGAELARIGGTTTDITEPAGATGFSPRFSVDASRLNLWGLGHTVSLRGRVSTLEQLASLNYFAPRFRNIEGRNISFTALLDDTRDVRTFSSRREEASIQISQQLSKPSMILFRYAYRRVSTSNVVIPALLIPQLLQPVRIGSLEANYVQDRRDNPADARRGIYNTVNLSVASNIFGSQRSFVRGLFRNATYHPLGGSIVLARQTTVGMILPFHVPPGLSAQNSIPLPERFFGGGSATDRGFPENQAGPRDIGTATTPATGFPLGGNALLFNNVELRFPLIGNNIGGVLFWDAGNIYSSVSKISFRASQRSLTDFDYMVHAVGFGIRYRTPVGPLRADLAYSLNPPHFKGFKGTVQDLLACGPAGASTCQSVEDSISHFQFFISIGQTF